MKNTAVAVCQAVINQVGEFSWIHGSSSFHYLLLPSSFILSSVLVVFDLDGTLIDSKRDLADAINALLVELGAEILPIERVTEMIGDGAVVLVRPALTAAGLS